MPRGRYARLQAANMCVRPSGPPQLYAATSKTEPRQQKGSSPFGDATIYYVQAAKPHALPPGAHQPRSVQQAACPVGDASLRSTTACFVPRGATAGQAAQHCALLAASVARRCRSARRPGSPGRACTRARCAVPRMRIGIRTIDTYSRATDEPSERDVDYDSPPAHVRR